VSYPFEKYLVAFNEGLMAVDLTTDQNPYKFDEHAKMGWWHGKMLAATFEKDFTADWMLEVTSTTAWYWKAHAQGMAAHRLGKNLMANPYSPKGWDSFQCPEDGDKVGWNAWSAGWRYGALLNNYSHPEQTQ